MTEILESSSCKQLWMQIGSSIPYGKEWLSLDADSIIEGFSCIVHQCLQQEHADNAAELKRLTDKMIEINGPVYLEFKMMQIHPC
jgi:hypothetical protein